MIEQNNVPDYSILREKAGCIYDRLVQHFGIPEWPELAPLDELINTILSQNTNDRNRDVAYGNLRDRFSYWDEVREAPIAEVIDCIRSAGLANQKGPRIQAVLNRIYAENGSLSLDFLRTWEPAKIREWLTSLHGVGMKTASIVMLFSLGIPAFPVDTHIFRVTGRLGLRPSDLKMTADQAHDHLALLFSPENYRTAHINLILLGRRICAARNPNCSECFLNDVCDYFFSNKHE
jgi:endonuclease-3